MTDTAMTAIFAGPSLSAQDSARFAGFDYHGPVQEGDILRLMETDVRRIGIIDGYFGDRRSVSHKEILLAMSRGILVYGASSMGALRAAELDSYGMIGVGEIYLEYRSGRRVDDGDVAVAHGPKALGYLPTSVPLVEVQSTVAALVARRRVSQLMADQVIAVAAQQYFGDRTWASIAQAAFEDRATAQATAQMLADSAVQSKRLDALSLLAQLAAGSASVDMGGCACPPLTHTFRSDLRKANCSV